MIILFNFVQFLISFEFAFSLYLVHAIFTARLLYELPFAFSGFPLLSCLSKIPTNSRKHPKKLEILKTYLSTLTNDTVPISLFKYKKGAGPCMAVLYSTDVYMSCTLVSFTNLPGLSRSTKRRARPCPRRVGTEKQGWLYT